ncbi:MAG: metallophosphoesterase [bacterium]|nr:metallophosphoesterase [bacterium]
MKILVVSDTHRRNENLRKVLQQVEPVDMLIHLGDGEGLETQIRDWVGKDCLLHMVLGNNDFFSALPRELEISIGNHRAFLTHGHYYNVSLDVGALAEEAKSRGCDIAMYGHTHKPFLEVRDGVTVLNPGSLSFPRQDGRRPSYMLLELDREGELHYTQNYLAGFEF